ERYRQEPSWQSGVRVGDCRRRCSRLRQSALRFPCGPRSSPSMLRPPPPLHSSTFRACQSSLRTPESSVLFPDWLVPADLVAPSWITAPVSLCPPSFFCLVSFTMG